MAGYSVEKALEDRKKRIKEEEYNARYREALKDPEGYANKNKPISVEDALKERKKSLLENSGSIKNDIARRYNSVLSSYKSYANNYSDSLYGEGSVKKTLDKQRSTRKETASLVSDIKAYRKIIGEKEADDMLKNLDSMKGVYDYAYEAAKVYTNFKSEEDYQNFMNPTSDVIPVGNGAMSPFRKGGLSPIGANSPGGIYSFDPMMKQTALGQLPFELNKNKDPLPTEDVKDENRLALYVYYTEKAREAESNGGSEEEIKAYRQQAEKARSKEGYQEIMSGWLTKEGYDDDESIGIRQSLYSAKKAELERLEYRIRYASSEEEKEKLTKKKESIEAEINVYERFRKPVDDTSNYVNQEDFTTVSADKNKNGNIDKSNLERAAEDLQKLRGTEPSDIIDETGIVTGVRDALGNVHESRQAYYAYVDELYNLTQTTVEDELGLFLSYSPEDRERLSDEYLKQSSSQTSNDGYKYIFYNGMAHAWDQLSENEINTYYYLYNSQGKNAAVQYLESLQSVLNYRLYQQTSEKWQKEYDESGVLGKILLNIGTLAANPIGGMVSFVEDFGNTVTGKDIDPYSGSHYVQNWAQSVRGNTARDIEEATDGAAIPLIDFSFGDFYQSIMSGADSFVGGKMFGRGYTVIMGMGAASSEAKDLYDKGATKEQIVLGASAAGAAEMIFEYVSLDHFLKNMDTGTKSVKQLLKQVLSQAGVEASEEVFTEIANTLTNAWVMKSQSEWAKLKEEGGLKNAFIETCKNVINAGIGGFVSGGGMAAVGSTANLIHYNNYSRGVGTQINQRGNTQNLIDYAEEIVLEYDKLFPGADTKQIGKFVSQLKQSIANGGEMSRSDLTKTGKLYDLVSDAVQKHSVQAVKSKIFDKLQDRADVNYKSYTAKLLTNAFFDNMSDTEKTAFKRMKGQKILDSLLSDSDTSDFLNAYKNLYDNGADFIFDRNANAATGNINSDVSQYTEQPAQTANTPLSLAPSETVRENAQGVGQDISAPRVEETPTATTQDNTDRERSAEALNYALEDIDNKHISKAATDLIKAEYDGTLPAADYVAGMEEGFNFGYSQVPEDGLTDYSGPFGQLSAMQKKHSYNLGVLAREEETRKRDTEVQAKIKDAAERSSGKNKDITVGRKIGTVKGEGVTIADLKKTFNDTQNKAYKILSTTAEIAGVDIVLYKSETDENGNFTGAQGKFKYSEDKLYIDINAGLLNEMDASELGAYVMVRTFCHEFVHFIEKWNVKGYNELRSLTFQTLQSRGINVDAEIRNTMDKLALDDYDKASREVVAETFTDVLPDSKFAQNIAEKNPGLFKKILEKLKEFLENVKSYFRSLGKNGSRVANAMKEEVNGQIRYIQNIVDVFDKVAEQAVENYQRTFAVNDTFESESAETEKQVSEPTENEKPVRKLEEKTKTSLSDYEKTAGIAHKIIKASTKDRKPIRLSDGDMFFVGNPSCVAVVDKETFDSFGDEILTNKSAEFTRLLDMRRQKLTGTAYSYKSENGKNLLYIKDKDGGVLLDKKYAKFFDGYDFYCDPENERVPVLFKDGNGEFVGLLAQMHKVGNINTDNLDVVNMKSFPIKEVTSNGRRNLGIQGQESSGETVRSDNGGAVSTSDADGQGTSRLLEEVQKEDVQGNGGRGDAAAAADKRGRTPERLGDGTDAADRTRGSGGNSEVGDIRRDDVVTEAEEKEKKESIKKVVDEQIEQKSTQTPKGRNFVIGESLSLPQGEKARFRANVEAIKLVKKLEAENRFATPAEQEVLSKYVGWGGLSNAFGEIRWNSTTRKSEMTPKNGWAYEFAEFRKLVDDGVISEDEYKAASASTKNAHYTSVEVIKAMYDGLENLGFKGGRMLEPSSGVGNFVGAMPVSMSSKVNSWTMVELDSITGLIAKYLYPNADVRIQGFEKANLPNNYMDVAIGNVPFGNYGVVDNAYPKRVTKAIHNYFFAKTLDKVRPGGVVMFITSSFTMNGKDNAIRQYIMDRADLLGAIRLPNNAFSGNAGTQVVTDILILKKRESGTAYGGEQFLNTSWQKFEENGYDGYDLNEYFINHPEMVLGTPAKIRGMYGANSLTYNPLDGGSLGEQIKNAFKNITGKMDYSKPVSANAANFRAAREEKKPKKNGFTNVDGKLFKNTDGVLEEVKDGNTAKRITGLLGIRDAYRTLINYIQQGQTKNLVAKARKDLNDVYDKFVKENGYINAPKNKSAIKDDPDSFSIYSLENYDAESKKATKADIFVKDTIKPNRTVTHVDDVATGIIVSVNTVGGIDTALIAKLTGKGEQDVVRELIDNRMAFKTQDGSLETPEKYLSGNVRAKLREAEALAPIDKDFENNVEELKKVVPKDIPFNDIYVTPGSPWIPTDVYADFVAYMLGGYNTASEYRAPDVEVGRSNQTGAFKIVVNNKHLKQGYKNTQKWGTKRKTFLDIIGAMMSSRSITVNDTIETEDGRKKSVINKVETAAAQEKAEEITREFQDWIWKDEARKNALTSLYNNTYNALVNPKYDGSHLAVNGLNASFSLREHQANAVQRIITSGGNTLLAHKVGAGKTLEMAAAAMKLKELGIIKKPMFVVPKPLVAQWGVEFKKYFPASKLLVTDEKDFVKANRKTFANRIANGDYDAVILSYEQFEKIPMSKDFQKKFYQEQIDEIVAAIAEEKAETGGRGLTVKEMEKKKSQLEKKQAELTRKEKDEDNIDFEQLGIDSLFVDEAHSFKNLAYVTNMNNVSGLGRTDGSQRAFDLYTKVRYMQGLNGGRGIVFATATPVMNSMAEMYIMQKYLQSDMLNQLGLSTFDAWAKQFGEIVNSVEIKPSGQGFRVKQTFSNFKNLNELQLLFRSFSDVLTQVQGLKIPKMKGGKVKTVLCEPGQFQKDYMAELEKRADNVKNVDPSVDNMLKITSDGRKVAYTQRMIDPSLPYEAGCKIYKCCDNIIKEYKDSSAIKGTQIVFCDMATPKGTDKKKAALADETEADVTELDTESAKLYDDMKAYLVKHGIPASEIAFIHDAKTDQKKKQLFEDVNNGNVRVLIGSTGKMGVGMNAQKRIVAIHHLDAPWRPGDVEQRDGRAFRQGNINEEVSKYVYVTEGSFDARLWDILDRKQHFINQIMNGDNVGRTAEDTGDVTLSAAEVKALASGNPLIMEQVQLSNELQKLEDLQRAHKSSVLTAQTKSLEDKQRILQAQKTIENITADIKARVDTYSDGKFSMTVDKKTFTDKKEAGVSLLAEITTKALTDKYVSVGKFAGFDLFAMKDGVEYSGIIKGQSSYKFNVYMSNTTQMINKICSVVSELDERLNAWKERLSELKADLAAQEKMAVEPFAKQEELDKKRARFNEVMEILNPPEEQQIADDEDEQYDYGDRPVKKEEKKKRKGSWYSQEETRFLSWSHGSASVGEVNTFIRFKKRRYYEKTADGCVELSYKQYCERENDDAEESYKEAENIIGRNADRDESSEREVLGNNDSDGYRGEVDVIPGQTFGEKLRSDTGRGGGTVDRGGVGSQVRLNDDEQYQQRTDTLTDRRVLELAAEDVRIDDLTQGEVYALDVFKKRLETIRDLQTQRKEQGQLYKEQQFGSKTDKAEAVKTLNRMKILDDQIKKASAELLSVEEKEVLKRVLQRARKVIEAKDREETKEILRRQSERRKESEAVRKYRQRIKLDVSALSSWILNPDNKTSLKRVPDVLKNSVIQFISDIDFTSKRQLRGGAATKADEAFVQRLQSLHDALKNNKDIYGLYSGYNDLPEDFIDRLQSFINATDAITKRDGVFVINKMTGEELKELSKIVRTLKKFITEMNIFHYNAVFSHVTDAAESTITELRSIKNAGIFQNGVTNWGFWQNIRPAYAFERFGEGGKAIYDEFRRAQATLAFNAKEIIEFAENTYTRAEVKAWEKEYKEFNLDGDTVRVPVSYIMSLYKLYDDPDGRRHILGEGARVAAHKEGVIRKEQDSGHKLSEEDVKQIIGTLTDRQKAVADALQEFMATQGAAWGNYVSVKRFGEEIFTNPKYFPISSDGRYIEAAAAEHPNEASLYALLNMSFTKKRNENADNRIVLFSIFDVFANHMASMAQYNAFALPVLDALKWYNYRQVSVDEKTGAKTVTGSVRDEMARAYGVSVEKNKTIKGYAEKFVENIIKAYNGTEARGDDSETPLLKMLNKYNRSKVGANLKVTFMQPLAYIRAAAEMKYRSLATGLTALVPKITPSVKSETEEMYKYSGIAVWKSLGFFDINISRGLTERIKHDSSLVDEVVEKSMYGAEKADEITWSLMWKASKAEVKKKQPYLNPGSAEFFSEVNRVFEDTIYKTQVVDSVLTKSEFMRKKNFIARMGSSFMAEPVTTMSMVMSAYEQVYEDMRKGMKFKDAVWKNRKRIVNATFLYVLSALAAAVLQAFGAMWRDEDDEREFGERFWKEFVKNFFDELAPWNKLPWVSNVIEYVNWGLYKAGISESYEYKPKTMIEDIVDSVAKAWRIFKGEEKGYEFYAGVSYMLEAVSDISGLPLAAATREVVAIWNNTIGSLNSDLKVLKYESNATKAKKYIDLMDSGEKQKAKAMYDKMVSDKKEEIRKNREKDGKIALSDAELDETAKKSVNTSVKSEFRKQFVEAFKNNDEETKAKIRVQMLRSGLWKAEKGKDGKITKGIDGVIYAQLDEWVKEYKQNQ